MACEYNFSAELPHECAFELLARFRSGDVLERKGEALQIAAQSLGQIGALMTGVPTFGASQVETPDTLEACCDELERFSQARSHDPQRMSANPLIAALIKKFLKLLIDQLLS